VKGDAKVTAKVLAMGATVVDFRGATGAEDRDARLSAEIARLEKAAAAGDALEVILPADRDMAAANRLAGMPLVHLVVHVARESGAAVTVHTRTGSVTDFLALAPARAVRVVFHLNGEEAAMRWEARDAAPGRRLSAACRLAREGWGVSVRIGAVRLFRGWRDDCADLAEALGTAALAVDAVYFPGEHPMEPRVESGGGMTALVAADGVRFVPTPRQRREVAAILAPRTVQGGTAQAALPARGADAA
jgi:hypothetical protein